MEQESIFKEIPTEKLFKPLGIYIGTFVGGPLVAGYLIACNYAILNERQNAIRTWVFTILGTALIIYFSFVINYSSNRQIPGYLLPLIYSVITYNIVNLVQKRKITNYIADGGEFHSWGRTIVVAIVGLAITLLGLLVTENILDWFR